MLKANRCAVVDCPWWGESRHCGIWLCHEHAKHIDIRATEHGQGSRILGPYEKTGAQIFEENQALLNTRKACDLMRKTDREQNG